jgi:hypothetical protein
MIARVKNFYHYVLAMLYLKIAHRYARYDAVSDAKWHYWMNKSQQHADIILKSLDGVK